MGLKLEIGPDWIGANELNRDWNRVEGQGKSGASGEYGLLRGFSSEELCSET